MLYFSYKTTKSLKKVLMRSGLPVTRLTGEGLDGGGGHFRPHHQETSDDSREKFKINSKKLLVLNFLLDQGPFCGATDCPYFGLHVTLPLGYKARVVLSTTLTCMCTVNLRVVSGAIPAFSTNRGVHCTSVYKKTS